jgi:DNA invertase Pin-like site-specific DNA recombinase
MSAAHRREIDTVICWRLDRFGRNLRHLISGIEELNSAGVEFISLGESIDTGSPTGRLLLGVMGSFAEFERERIRERIHAGIARARKQGQRIGRKRERITDRDLVRVEGMSLREAGRVLGVPPSRVQNERRRRVRENPGQSTLQNPPEISTADAPA